MRIFIVALPSRLAEVEIERKMLTAVRYIRRQWDQRRFRRAFHKARHAYIVSARGCEPIRTADKNSQPASILMTGTDLRAGDCIVLPIVTSDYQLAEVFTVWRVTRGYILRQPRNHIRGQMEAGNN